MSISPTDSKNLPKISPAVNQQKSVDSLLEICQKISQRKKHNTLLFMQECCWLAQIGYCLMRSNAEWVNIAKIAGFSLVKMTPTMYYQERPLTFVMELEPTLRSRIYEPAASPENLVAGIAFRHDRPIIHFILLSGRSL